MALSFEESKKLLKKQTVAATPMMMSLSHDDVGIMTLDESNGIAAYSGDDGNWQQSDGYAYYSIFSDDNLSIISDEKDIVLNKKQFNITQESNSQYVPFEMNRYYDGLDLSEAAISIHYENGSGDHGASTPINVTFSDGSGDQSKAKLRFGWLIPSNATKSIGKLKFEIHAVGSIPGSEGEDGKPLAYIWKTKCNENLNVLQSLCSTDCLDGRIEVNSDWVQEIVTDVAEKVAAQVAQANIATQVEAAENAATRAETAASDAESAATNAVNIVLQNYSTTTEMKTYVGEEIAKIPTPDVSGQIGTHNTDANAHSDIRALIPTKVSDLTNDSGYLTNIPDEYVTETELSAKGYLTAHQSLAGLATETYVSDKLGNLVDGENKQLTVEAYVKQEVEAVDVSEQLGDTGTDEEGKPKTVVQYVNEKIGELGQDDNGDPITNVVDYVGKKMDEVDVSDQLGNYATVTSLDEVKTSLNTVSGNVVTNATNIATIQSDVNKIQSSLNSLEGDNQNLIIQYSKAGSILRLYERDEKGDITIEDGGEQVKVKEISYTTVVGAGGGDSTSTISIAVKPDGDAETTVLDGNEVLLNYTLSTTEPTEDENGETVKKEIGLGDVTFSLYKDDVYITQFTVKKTSSEVYSDDIDVSEYISLGTQVFSVVAVYMEQLGDGETVPVRSKPCRWTVTSVSLKLDDLPDELWESTPKYGSTTFSYTPIGALEKKIYFKIDNKEPETVVTSLNGTTLSYTIPKQTHGIHTLQIWCEGNVCGKVIPTEPRNYVLMFVEDGNDTPIIRIKSPTTLEQYSSTDIYYNVFDPLNAIIDFVTIYDEDGVILSSVENITSAERKFEFKSSVVKNKTITIKYKETTSSVEIEVTKFPYEINAVTGNLMVDFIPTGRTNSDVDYNVFKNNAYTVEKDSDTGEEVKTEIPMTWTFSDNFDWINGGWKTTINNDGVSETYFCVKAGTFVEINYNLFGTDGVVAKKDANGEYTIAGTGKEFKLVFKTTNVAQANATWLECVDIADKNTLGIRMEAQNAYIDSSLGTLEIPYVDDDIIEFDMNIVPMTKFLDNGEPDLNTKVIPMVITYEDGTPVQPKVITSASTNFKQDTPKPITIGSEYCDVHIYRMKIYERYLEDKEIITNFIADARSGVEMAKRYVRNDIYPIENKQKITPESVATACPDLKVYVISAPYFTNDKGDKVENTTIRQLHNTGTKENPEWDINENWTAINSIHNGQGTSSNEYGYSGRNLEFNMKKATITLRDGSTVVKEIKLSPTSYPTNYLNFKINIASSENANNALLQKRYDRYLPYTTIASLMDDRKKNSMEFFNCVVFIQETNEDISTHREFNDCNIHFYGIGNIGDSKKTDNSRVNDVDDPNEFCVEIMDWNRELSSFPTNTIVNAMRYTVDSKTKEKKYVWAKDENLDILYELVNGEYVLTEDITVDVENKVYYVDALQNDDFSEDFTYGWRYLWKDGTDEENAEAFKNCKQKWIDFYKFVTRDLTTNGVEDSKKVDAWKSEFSDWFILDSALYYYLYTLRYTMVDNRAKNSFWHWGKYYITFEEALEKGIAVYDEDKNLVTDTSNPPSVFYDANGNVIENIDSEKATINDGYRMEFWMYDNDTAIGIDNAGKLEIPYGVEDGDVDAAGVPYFRAHNSTVFVRIPKYFTTELEDAWYNTEINPAGKVFDSIGFINEFDAWQEEFPEELWRLDYERKYKRTYVGGTGKEWDYALPKSNKSEITDTRFLTEMMNGRKKYQRRCFERNQEIYMSSKFMGEVNRSDTITLRGTGDHTGTDKVVPYNHTLTITPFSKMYINLHDGTNIYYHVMHEAGETVSIDYSNTTLDFIYIRGASQIQSLGDLSPMYLQTATLTPGAKLKTITLGNATNGYYNDSLKSLQIGAGNKLLEELDIRNLSNLNNTELPVVSIPSLKRVYAQGSNITEARFANNGLLEEAYLPKTIIRLELRNLHYLNTIELESYDNLLYLTVMNCSDMINDIVLDMINQAHDLKELRATNIDWELSDTTVLERLYKLIKTSDSPEVVLSGKVHVPIIGQKQLEDYNNAWPDLTITYDEGGLIRQYPVEFVNYDGKTTLITQYVDHGKNVIDPIANGDIEIPTRESSVSTNYIYDGWFNTDTNKKWDPLKDTISVYKPITIKATYTEEIRKYTVRYASDGVSCQPDVLAPYGSVVLYEGETPTLTRQEDADVYHLFTGWDKFGYVDGDKTINAVYQTCNCNIEGGASEYFKNKDISDMRPVDIYAMTKIYEKAKIKGEDFNISNYVDLADKISITLGNDVSYEDLRNVGKEKTLISNGVCVLEGDYKGASAVFNGSNHIDTGIKLFDEDKDFVLAIDYSMSGNNSIGNTLAQCYSSNESSGFKLAYIDGVDLRWGNSSTKPTSVNKREVVILRHVKGEYGVHVYNSNMTSSSPSYVPLSGIHSMIHENTLVFGCNKTDGGEYKNHALGSVYWSKIWYVDLEEEICRQLAAWVHETIDFEMCGFEFYPRTSGGKECAMTFLATSPLSVQMPLHSKASTEGGWAECTLNTYLNSRVYNAFPIEWRQLMQQVDVKSSAGKKSTATPKSACYVFIPCVYEINSTNGTFKGSPYIDEVHNFNAISYFGSDNKLRILYHGGQAVAYWTRSPNLNPTSDTDNYQYKISSSGSASGFQTPTELNYIRTMFSL